MNYDHAFHAGNFADVFKHVVLTRILVYLKHKPTAFRVIETHAGRGAYRLAESAGKGAPEWRMGVGRLDPAALSAHAQTLMAPYLDLVEPAVTGAAPYPGSPLLALRLSRAVDRLLLCELHPAALAALRVSLGRDRRAKTIGMDGYAGLKAFIPPVERRGLVLIDPPFEAADEFDRLAEALVMAHGKWQTGILLAWYPIKDRRGVARLVAQVGQAMPMLRLELDVDAPAVDGRLASSGLLVVNPPHTLEGEMACLLPELRRQLETGRGGWRIDRHAKSA